MTPNEQNAAAKKFASAWKGRGSEKSDCQTFWIDLLTNVFGVQDISDFIPFSLKVLFS